MSISKASTALTEIEQTKDGWYFYFKDGSCRIGPYTGSNAKEECQKDFNRYLKTGRISTDEKKKLLKEE
jgi:hypothetical protein